jgi:acyl carrier protein
MNNNPKTTPNLQNTFETIRSFVADIYDTTKEAINMDTVFTSLGTFDDLRALEIVVAMETHFALADIPENMWNKMNSVKSCLDYVMENFNPELETNAAEYSKYISAAEDEREGIGEEDLSEEE